MAALTELKKDWLYTWQLRQDRKKNDHSHGSADRIVKRLTLRARAENTEKNYLLYMTALTALKKYWPYIWQRWQSWKKDWPYTWQRWQNWKKTDFIHASAENTAGRLTSYMAALRTLQKDWPHTWQRWEYWRKTDLIHGSTDSAEESPYVAGDVGQNGRTVTAIG